MKEFFLEERGIYYRTNDLRADRPTLVLIHGLSGSASAWAQFEAAWEKNFNVITPDLRGHGKSRKPDGYDTYEVEKMADDIVALLKHLNVTSYTPLSQSFGTFIALALMRQYPGAQATVFMSSTYGIYHISLTKISRALIGACSALAQLFSYSDKPGTHVDYSKFRHAGDWNMRRIFKDIPNTSWHVWFYCLHHAYSRDLDPWWADVRIPSLVMHGRLDQISPVAEGIAAAKAIPSAELHILEGVSHVFPITAFEKANPIVEKFLNEVVRE